MTTGAQLRQFVDLWQRIRGIQLTTQPNQIRWRFSADGRYSSRSAYMIQFQRVYKGLQVGRYLENKGGEQMQVLPLAAIAKEAAHVGSNN